jgi:hypothetical protein
MGRYRLARMDIRLRNCLDRRWKMMLAVSLASAAFVIAGALSLVAPSATSAAPIRECGRILSRLAFNITTRVVSCPTARAVVYAWSGSKRIQWVRGLRCVYRSTGFESGDIRCTGTGGRVVHWQTGS